MAGDAILAQVVLMGGRRRVWLKLVIGNCPRDTQGEEGRRRRGPEAKGRMQKQKNSKGGKKDKHKAQPVTG